MRQLLQMFGFLALSSSALSEEIPTRFRMGVEAGLGYNSNPYSLRNPVGDMMASISPSISLATQGRKLTLGINANANTGILFGLNGNPGFLVLSGGAGGASTYNTNGVLSFFTQGNVTASRSLTELFVGNLNNLTGAATLGSTFRPGSGKWSVSVQGEYIVQGFTNLSYQNQESVPRLLNNQAYYLSSRLAWQFLPRTALYSEARYGFYENMDANNLQISINPLWVGGGLTGQITPRLTANVSAHFSKIFIKGVGQTLSGTSVPVGAKIALDWTLPSHSSINLSATRELSPAPIFLDQATTSLSLLYQQRLFEKLTLTTGLQGGLLEYGKPYTNRIQGDFHNRQDIYGGASLGLAYNVQSWLAVGVSGEGFWRWTNTDPNLILDQIAWVASGDGSDYQSLFSRYLANAFVRLTY